MTQRFTGRAAPSLLCCLLLASLAFALVSGATSYNPNPRYDYGPAIPPSPYGAPRYGGAYGPTSADPNQRFFLPNPFKGIVDKFNIFNKGGYPSGQYGGFPPNPFTGFNPFAGLCNPGGGYTTPGSGGGPQPPGYNPPAFDPVYNPPGAPGYSPPGAPGYGGNRPIVIYTRPSSKSPTYNRPIADDKPMLTSRPHPIFG